MTAPICFLGDVHGQSSWVRYVVKQAAKRGCKQIVQLGDFGFWPRVKERPMVLSKRWDEPPRFVGPPVLELNEGFIDEVEASLAEFDMEMTIIDGNHEWHDYLATLVPDEQGFVVIRPHIRWATRGTTWSWEDVTFLAVGGAPSIDRDLRAEGYSWWPGETLSESDVQRCLKAGRVDVVVSHDAPYEERLEGLHDWPPGDEHRRLLSQIVRSAQPRWLFHGHYHMRFSAMTHVGQALVRTEAIDRDSSMTKGYLIVSLDALSRAGYDPALTTQPGEIKINEIYVESNTRL